MWVGEFGFPSRWELALLAFLLLLIAVAFISLIGLWIWAGARSIKGKRISYKPNSQERMWVPSQHDERPEH